jgi:hypothetical protein
MTLIETVSSGKIAIQASDRLVSLERQPYDEWANKTVLFTAIDAVVVMSYTGDAYVGDEPTDVFIARILNGGHLPTMSSGKLGICVRGAPKEWPTLDESIAAVGSQLAQGHASKNGRTESVNLKIYGIGWRRTERRGHQERIVFEIKRPNSASYGVAWYPPTARKQMFILPSISLDAAEVDALKRDLEAVRTRTKLIDLLEGVEHSVVASIQRVAKKHADVIGEDCVAVTIPPVGDIRIRYHPRDPMASQMRRVPDPMGQNAPLEFKALANSGMIELPMWYSPWIIGPELVHPPANMSGPQIMPLSDSGRQFFLQTTAPIEGAKFRYSGTADRKSRP